MSLLFAFALGAATPFVALFVFIVVTDDTPASAIEARSGETTEIGSTVGESAAAKPDAQNGGSNGI